MERMAVHIENMEFGSLAPEQNYAILGFLEKNTRK
jgi:hypothetical protein